MKTTPDTLDDARLVQLGLAGNGDAFGQLVARYQSPIFPWLLWLWSVPLMLSMLIHWHSLTKRRPLPPTQAPADASSTLPQ